jgi:hypothetical protein
MTIWDLPLKHPVSLPTGALFFNTYSSILFFPSILSPDLPKKEGSSLFSSSPNCHPGKDLWTWKEIHGQTIAERLGTELACQIVKKKKKKSSQGCPGLSAV